MPLAESCVRSNWMESSCQHHDADGERGTGGNDHEITTTMIRLMGPLVSLLPNVVGWPR